MTDPSLKNYESLIFDSETTYKDNFRVWELKPDVKTTYKEKKLALRPCPVPLKDLHALTAWRDPNVPFDLYHRPKEIIRTDPRVIQKSYVALEPVKEPYVSPEWRMDSMRWDKRQLRTYTEPTKKFWLSRGLSHCPEYKATGRPTNQRRGF